MIIGSINTPLEQNLPVVTFLKEGLLQNCWINFRLLCLINSKWPWGNNNSHNCWRSAAGTRSIWFHELFTVKRLTKLLPQIPASQEQNTQDLNVSAHWLQITSQRNLIPSSLDRLPSFSLVISCDLLCENRLKVTENSVACCCLSPGSKLPWNIYLLSAHWSVGLSPLLLHLHLSLPLLLQQTVMQYQLSDDLPSAPPFRLFPTIERDTGGRSENSPPRLTLAIS